MKCRTDNTTDSDNNKFRMNGEKGKKVWHIIKECLELAQHKYKKFNDNVTSMINWELWKSWPTKNKDVIGANPRRHHQK